MVVSRQTRAPWTAVRDPATPFRSKRIRDSTTVLDSHVHSLYQLFVVAVAVCPFNVGVGNPLKSKTSTMDGPQKRNTRMKKNKAKWQSLFRRKAIQCEVTLSEQEAEWTSVALASCLTIKLSKRGWSLLYYLASLLR
jgi:hypothetical protein